MCGRYYYSDKGADSKNAAIAAMMEKYYKGRYKTGEIFPGDPAPGVIAREGKLLPVPAVFGYPGFSGGKRLINARAETAAEKPAFADSLRRSRIILPANGFFEWSRDEKRAKYRFSVDDAPTIYLCGLYKLVDGVPHFVILTRAANESMAEIHDRMPVIAGEEQVRPYLTDTDAALEIIATACPMLTREAV